MERLTCLWLSPGSSPCKPRTQTQDGRQKIWEDMEELLLPNGEDEAPSDNGSCAPGEARRTMGGRVKTFLQGMMKGDLQRTVRGFLKRNGLLTLSVIAVVTGCTLGFMLRGTQLSTQVTSPGGHHIYVCGYCSFITSCFQSGRSVL